MGRYVIWIAFVVTLQISTVLCRNPFQEYFYNKYHHKGHSTTVSISSSTSDTSSEEITASSVSDYASLEDVLHSSSGGTLLKDLLHSSTVDLGTTVEGNLTILQYGERHKFHHIFFSRIALVVGGIIAFLCIIGVIVCCCPKCCRGSEHRVYDRTYGIESATEVAPQQPILVPYPRQQVVIERYPPHYPDEQYLPEYQPQMIQPQSQYCSGPPQFYNMPEAPPPYESPPKY